MTEARHLPAALIFLIVNGTGPADAAHRPSRHHSSIHSHGTQDLSTGRPRAWCGYWMRFHNGHGTDPGPSYNLAANWSHWGTASALVPGAIVVYRHHVVLVDSVLGGGRIMATSGNDGGAVRTRVRSVAGAIAVRG